MIRTSSSLTLAPILAVIIAACGWNTPESEPFELYTHCGLDRRLIEFDGSFWRATGPGPLSDDSGNPPRGFDNPFDIGSIARTGNDTAVFVSSQGVRVDLVRLDERPDLIPCR